MFSDTNILNDCQRPCTFSSFAFGGNCAHQCTTFLQQLATVSASNSRSTEHVALDWMQVQEGQEREAESSMHHSKWVCGWLVIHWLVIHLNNWAILQDHQSIVVHDTGNHTPGFAPYACSKCPALLWHQPSKEPPSRQQSAVVLAATSGVGV